MFSFLKYQSRSWDIFLRAWVPPIHCTAKRIKKRKMERRKKGGGTEGDKEEWRGRDGGMERGGRDGGRKGVSR